MGDSTCVMQSFDHSSQQQGDPLRALRESVSFGRFMTETLEWEKWSTFNQNRYLEEAQRISRPGLVAQKKALFEAHFKKIAADRAAALLEASDSSTSNGVPKHGLRNENHFGPCIDLESGKFDSHSSVDAAQNSTNAPFSLDHAPASPLMESQFREAYYDEKYDSTVEVSDFGSVNNSDPEESVKTDEPSCDMAVDTSPYLELCDKMDSRCDTSNFNYIVVEPSSFKNFDPPDGLKAEREELDRSEDVYSTMIMAVSPKKSAVQRPEVEIALTSTDKYKPTLTCSKKLASVRKPAVQSHSNPRPQALPRKENNATHSTRAFGSALLNKKRVTTKSLHMSINLDSSHQDSKRPLTPKNLGSTKKLTNTVSLRGCKERPDQVTIDTMSQKKLATSLKTLTAVRKSSAELYIRQAPPQLHKDNTLIQRDMASFKNSIDIKKFMPKSLHMSNNLVSHVGEKERHSGTKADATAVKMLKTPSTHAPVNQVISDTKTRRKQIIPVLNTSAVGTKLVTQFHAKQPPLYKNKNSGIHSNSACTFSQIDIKKSLPKSLHMSVDLSSTVGVVRKPTIAQKREFSSNNVPFVRVSGDSSNPMRASLKKSIQTSTILQFDDKGSKRTKTTVEDTANRKKNSEKCPPHKNDRPETPANPIRPPSPTVSTPFRFRSNERAAERKKKLEEKYKVEFENSLHGKGKELEEDDKVEFENSLHGKGKELEEDDLTILCRSINLTVRPITDGCDKMKQLISHEVKFPPSRSQSPMYVRNASPYKARETTNHRPPRTPIARKGGSHQVTGKKSSIASITSLPRKSTCQNASPNMEM
ncbi:unnamed protein product [Rhodiola kirilowii]